MLLPILTFALFCSGCARRPAAEQSALQHKETFYFDAELAFSIEYPSDWNLKRGHGSEPASCTVRWQPGIAPAESARNITATVTACSTARPPGGLNTGGFKEMISEFLLAHPAMIIDDEEEVDLPGGKGLLVLGKEEKAQSMAVFFRSESRGYILTFSAPTTRFEFYRPLFQEMIDSFRPLGEPQLSSSPRLRDHPEEPSPVD